MKTFHVRLCRIRTFKYADPDAYIEHDLFSDHGRRNLSSYLCYKRDKFSIRLSKKDFDAEGGVDLLPRVGRMVQVNNRVGLVLYVNEDNLPYQWLCEGIFLPTKPEMCFFDDDAQLTTHEAEGNDSL